MLPNNERVATLIIQGCHSRCAHDGRGHDVRGATLNELHSRRYWTTNGRLEVRRIIYKCVLCHRMRGRVKLQKMAELQVMLEKGVPTISTNTQQIEKWKKELLC